MIFGLVSSSTGMFILSGLAVVGLILAIVVKPRSVSEEQLNDVKTFS